VTELRTQPDADAAPAPVRRPGPAPPVPPTGMLDLTDSTPISEVQWRTRVQVGGHVRSVRVRPWGEVITFEAVLADATGALTVAFLGRRSIGGIRPGVALTVEGMAGERDGKLLILNPAYDLRPVE